MIPDSECTGDRLAEIVAPLLAEAPVRSAMAQAAERLGRRDAADQVAVLVESVARSAG
jgi:UDP-N-acetylglucosamine:LPS N-acetylglucosamine transferase